MYAVIRERGKQYKVEPGNVIEIDLKDDVKKGDTLEHNEVLMVSKDGEAQIGAPTIENAIQEKDYDKLVKYVLEGK